MIHVEQWGTFDVANYGDLLFPFVLQHELLRTLGKIDLTLASPYGVPVLSGPLLDLHRIVRFEEQDFYTQAESPDAFILGGGDIIP